MISYIELVSNVFVTLRHQDKNNDINTGSKNITNNNNNNKRVPAAV